MAGGLSRLIPCCYCGHDEHVLRCEALLDAALSNVLCPCRDVPVPGVYLEEPA
jgi:hypothetical protein